MSAPTTSPPSYRFPSKVDAGIMLILLLSFGVALVGGIFATVAEGAWIGMVLLVMMGGLLFLLGVPTEYRVGQGFLVVRSGMMRIPIALETIESVRPSRSWKSGPAWSFDRLEVRYRGRSVLISPVDKSVFLDALRVHDADLVPSEDGGLVRKPAKK